MTNNGKKQQQEEEDEEVAVVEADQSYPHSSHPVQKCGLILLGWFAVGLVVKFIFGWIAAGASSTSLPPSSPLPSTMDAAVSLTAAAAVTPTAQKQDKASKKITLFPPLTPDALKQNATALWSSPRCRAAVEFERTKAWQELAPGRTSDDQSFRHASCNQAHISHSWRFIYLENQKAGSRTILSWLRSFATDLNETFIPYSFGSPDRPAAKKWCASDLPAAATNYTTFTFVRNPLRTFLSGFAEVMQRLIFDDSKLYFDEFSAPEFSTLPCNESGRYLSSFVASMVERRPLGIPWFHVLPQALKLDVDLRLDFIGELENLGRDLERLLRGPLGVTDPVASRLLRRSAMTPAENDGRHNTNQCGEPIAPGERQVVQLLPVICALLTADYECLGDVYGPCDNLRIAELEMAEKEFSRSSKSKSKPRSKASSSGR